MGREFKFRAWDSVNKCWVPSGKVDEEVQINPTLRPANTGIFEFFTVFGSEVEISQLTGLKDRHGAEVWEGDMVTFEVTPDYAAKLKGRRLKGEVKWDDEDASFYFLTDTDAYPHVKPWYAKNIERIGDIFTNPELLERP